MLLSGVPTVLGYSRYHLKDVIVGKIYFLLVRIKLKYMELAIVKKEMAGTGTTTNPTLVPFGMLPNQHTVHATFMLLAQ